eukprot:4423480-Amphidinium_carterae.1
MAKRRIDKEAVARIYFVRHGRSTHNESDEDRPLIWDAPLHRRGVAQAAALCQELRNEMFDLCLVSPLTRAIQTALIALGEWSQLRPGAEVAIARSGHGVLQKISSVQILTADGETVCSTGKELGGDVDCGLGAEIASGTAAGKHPSEKGAG